MTARLLTLINDFSGGTAGVTITPSNSGNPSGNPFDACQVGSTAGNVLAYDSTHPLHGGAACKVAAPNSRNFTTWSSAMIRWQSTQATTWFRLYLYFASTPAFNVGVFQGITGGSTFAATLQVNATTGTLTFTPHSGAALTTTTAIPTGAWFRVEGFVTGDITAGQTSVSLYTVADSTTAAETKTSAATLNTAGAMNAWNFGAVTAAGTGNTATFWMGGLGLSNGGPIGPTPLGFTGVRQDDGGAITNVAIPATGSGGGNTIVAGGDVEGFFTTTDQGLHWATSNTGVYGQHWRRCACAQFSVTEPGTVYACVGLNGFNGGFLVSQNNGQSWFMRNTAVQYSGNTTGITGDKARSAGTLLAQCGVVHVSGQGNVPLMYTATYKGGVYRSYDNGNNWAPIGLTGNTHFGRGIVADPGDPANVFVSMYGEGVYNATNASTAGTASFSLQNSSPNFAEELVICSSGNVYVAGGDGAGGGLWTTPVSGTGSGTWSQVGGALTSTTPLSSSSYWMSLDGYTDAAGNDQLLIGCNSPVKGPGGAYRSLMWVTVTSSGVVFTDVSDVAAAIQVAYVPPDTDRLWWHTATSVPNPSQATGFREWLGGPGFFAPHATIDQTTINTTNVTVILAGACGVFTATGITAGATGPYSTAGGAGSNVQWALAVNGMPAYIAHQLVLDAGDPNHLAWATRDWGATELSDGAAYSAATVTQWTPPRPTGTSLGGFAVAIDPVSSVVFLSSGTKGGSNSNGQIYSRNNNFSLSNVSTGGTGGAPYPNLTTFNTGGNVAYGLCAGRNASNSPFLLAMVQGSASTGGMYRFSGYSISGAGNVTGGTWAKIGSNPLGSGSPLGTSGGASATPTGNQCPIIGDPNNAGVFYCFDQNTGLWRSSSYGAGTWTQIWAIVNNDERTGFIAANPAVAGELWVSYWTSNGTPGGLYKITGADTISQVTLTGGGANTVQVTGIGFPGAVCFATNGDVFCLSLGGDAPLSPNTQLMGSFDSGNTWFNADNGSVAATASYPLNMVMTPAGRVYIASNANVIAYGYPSIPVDTGAASMAVTVALGATGQDVPAGVVTWRGTASLALTASLSAVPSGTLPAFAALSVTTALVAQIGSAPFVVQVIQGTAAFDYGLSSVEITTTGGHTLVVLAGWDLVTTTTAAPMPAVYVTDSAGNYWYHVGTTTSAVTGARASAWICPNARAVEWLSVSLTTFASSLAYTVLELSGMPDLYSLDLLDATASASSNTLALNPGSAGDTGFAFALLAVGGVTGTPGATGGWTPLPAVFAGPQSTFRGITPPGTVPALPGNINPVMVFPYYQFPAKGQSLATTFTTAQAVPCAALVFAVRDTTYPPYQANPNFPVIKVEAGFGFTPGDPSQAPPTWTDITDRVIAPEGGTWFKTASGRQYELAQAEAGTLEIWVNNADSALTPGNSESPYYPDVVLGTPVRVSAYWDGQWYAIGYGWVERWPQEWPDLPQWGISKMIATDAISVMAAVSMPSALEGDILLDNPYVLLPASEQYLDFSNGVNAPGELTSTGGTLGSFQVADAQGLQAQNFSRSNQRTGMYVDGNGAATGGQGPAIAATGQTANLLGSAATGFGTTAITATPVAPSCGPGIIYTDPNIPDPGTGTGVTVSFWLIVPGQAVATTVQPTVFTAYGPPSSYRTTPSLSVQVQNFTGNNLLQITLADGTTVTAPFIPGTTAQQVTLIMTAVSLNVYINGALAAAVTLTAAQTTAWLAVSLGCPNYAYQSTGLAAGSFTAFDLAVYSYPLPAQRAVAQYATGLFGQQNVDATVRVAQILSWAALGLPRGGRQTFSGVFDGVTQGPAYSLAGATASAAVNQVAVNHAAMVAAMPGGSIVYIHRWALFNQDPVAVFGDADDPARGQVPYISGQSWGYDNTYLFNIAQVTQQSGANALFTSVAADFTSQHSYFARSALTETITTMSSLDAADLVNWLIAKYGQPSLRVSTVTVDAASNPTVAFPAVLPLLQGQAATVTRTPVGGVPITQTCLVQRIAHSAGPNTWNLALQLSPYVPEGNVLELDATGFDVVGNNTLA